MLADLQQRCPHYPLQGPISLPNPIPDIDLIVTDDNSSTIVIAELKWMQKTLRPVEIIERDTEVLKGIRQLRQVSQFLRDNPDHLLAQGRLPNRLDSVRTHLRLPTRLVSGVFRLGLGNRHIDCCSVIQRSVEQGP